jgi:hypothetical protein
MNLGGGASDWKWEAARTSDKIARLCYPRRRNPEQGVNSWQFLRWIRPLAGQNAEAYFTAVMAAILSTTLRGSKALTPDTAVEGYKKMLQALRKDGDPFN